MYFKLIIQRRYIFSGRDKTAAGGALISFLPEIVDAAGIGAEPIAKPVLAPGAGVTDIRELEEKRAEGAGAESGLAAQIKMLADSLQAGTLLTADITTNLQLDGNTIETIKQSVVPSAVKAVGENARRAAQGLPVTSP